MKIYVMAAMGIYNEIGMNNQLLWRIKSDMQFLVRTTKKPGNAIMMGRETFESFGGRSLPGRINIIITRNKDYTPKNPNDYTFVAHSLTQAISLAEELKCKEAYFLGGGQIYNQVLEEEFFPLDGLYITHVPASFPNADTYFPQIKTAIWKNYEVLEEGEKSEANDYDYEIGLYTKN